MTSVELVTHTHPKLGSGIGRFVRELHRYLAPHIDIRFAPDVMPPLANRLSILQHFPVGVEEHKPGALLHFTQIMGCSQQLWHRMHPSIVTVHDLGVLVCPEDELLFDRIGRFVLDVQIAGLRYFDQYTVNSDRTRRDLVEKLGIKEEKINFVQLGVELENFRVAPDARQQLADRYQWYPRPDGFDLIYVGSELPRKNLIQLLQAMAALKKRGYRLRLIKIGGAGGDRWRQMTLAAIEKYNLKDDVYFPGIVPEEDLPLFYNAADLAVQPTLLEGGFAWMAMEAMACGTPVIASEASCIPEDASEVVTVVETRSLNSLTDTLAALLDNPERRKEYGAKGTQIIQKYTWQATAEGMLRVYEKVV